MLALKGKQRLFSVSNTKVLTINSKHLKTSNKVLLWQIIYTKTHNLVMRMYYQ